MTVIFVVIFASMIAFGYAASVVFSMNPINAINAMAIPFIGICYVAGFYFRNKKREKVVKSDV